MGSPPPPSSSTSSMTQHQPPPASSAVPPTAPADTNATADANVGAAAPPLSLAAQIDAAMAQLLGVSSKWKDLSGADCQVSTREETIAMMQHYMDRLEMTQRVRASLSVIHVAGTKGKGSTCALTERILRQSGYKTGLFTSPHLISPCERIRINGKPVAPETFLRHFYRVWRGLESTSDRSGEYPPMAWFFRFLTLLALHIFLAEEVDVVILEVGIGGRLDATNVIEAPVVCGVTTLDLDHTRVLGDTLDKIAHAKAGIFKRGVPAFTTQQEPLAMQTLRDCAAETGTPLALAPVLDDFVAATDKKYELGMQGDYQRVNAGLAVALATTWLRHRRAQPFALPDVAAPLEHSVAEGLRLAFWPARSHVLDDPAHGATFYIDGAHTLRSLEVCAQWFTQSLVAASPASAGAVSTASASASARRKTALFFTIHYERNVASIIAPLLALRFDRVYFCPTGASRPSLAKMNTFSEALVAAELAHVVAKYSPQELEQLDHVPESKLQWQTTLARLWKALKSHTGDRAGQLDDQIRVLPSVVDCIADLRAHASADEEHWSVLATGSLYLAGETLDFLGWTE